MNREPLAIAPRMAAFALAVHLTCALSGCTGGGPVDTPAQTPAVANDAVPGDAPVPMNPQAAVPQDESKITLTRRGAIALDGFSKCVAWSPDGRRLLTAVDDACQLWDVRVGALVRRFERARVAAFHPDGKRIVTADETLALRDIETGAVVKEIRDFGTDLRPFALRLSASGERVLLFSILSEGWVCDFQAGTAKALAPEILGVQLPRGDIAPDGRQVAIGGDGGRLSFIDAASLQPVRTLHAHEPTIDGVSFFSDGKTIATCSETGDSPVHVRLWDSATGKKLNEYSRYDLLARGLRASPDGSLLAVFGRTLYVDNPSAPGPAHPIRVWKGAVEDAAFSPDGRTLAVVTSEDKFVYLFDVQQTE